MKDPGLDEQAYTKLKTNTNNGNLIFKICLSDSITMKELLNTFWILPLRHTKHGNICLGPDLYYDERIKRIILPI